jgi:hypothetical protein
MADNLTLIEFDGATGQEVVRELTKDEIAERKELAIESKKLHDELQAKEDAKASALAKLAALGLTEEEIAAL